MSIRDEEWNDFVDTGKISDSRVLLLCYKIQKNESLDDREMSMLQHNGAQIEKQLQLIIKKIRH